mgnify:CR=1 FL=1
MFLGRFCAGRSRQPHQQRPIAQPVAQGTLDAALEVRRGGGGIGDAAAGPNEFELGHTTGLLNLDQVGVAAVKPTGQGTGQGKELMHKAIAV